MCNNGKWIYITGILAFPEAAESLELWPEGPGSSLRLGVAMTARAVYISTRWFTQSACATLQCIRMCIKRFVRSEASGSMDRSAL